MKAIIVTGTPCTGKTILAKKLSAKLNYKYIDVNKIIKKYNLSEGYDKKRKTRIVDVKKLNKKLIELIGHYKKTNKLFSKNKKLPIKKTNNIKFKNKNKEALRRELLAKKLMANKKINGLVIDSHLSHYLPKKYVDLCVITKCDLKELNKRLKKRKYPKNKVRENLDAEIFDVCFIEASEAGHDVFVISTTKGIKTSQFSQLLNKGGLK